MYSNYPPPVTPAALPVSWGTQEAGTSCELSKPQGAGGQKHSDPGGGTEQGEGPELLELEQVGG